MYQLLGLWVNESAAQQMQRFRKTAAGMPWQAQQAAVDKKSVAACVQQAGGQKHAPNVRTSARTSAGASANTRQQNRL
jgi:hypothetical protein